MIILDRNPGPCRFLQVVIFVKSVLRAKELNKLLIECNFPSICIHSAMKQEERLGVRQNPGSWHLADLEAIASTVGCRTTYWRLCFPVRSSSTAVLLSWLAAALSAAAVLSQFRAARELHSVPCRCQPRGF